MVAIALAESSGNNRAQGDALSSFPADQQTRYAPYDCGGYLSFGLWQIFQGVHFGKLSNLTGSQDPCVWRDYLFRPEGNVWVAKWFCMVIHLMLPINMRFNVPRKMG